MRQFKLALVSVLFSGIVLAQESTTLQPGVNGEHDASMLVFNAVRSGAVAVIAKPVELSDSELSALITIFREDESKVAAKTLDFIHDYHLQRFETQKVVSNHRIPEKFYVVFPKSESVIVGPPSHYKKKDNDMFNRPQISIGDTQWLLFLSAADKGKVKLPTIVQESKFFADNALYQLHQDMTGFRLGVDSRKKVWDEILLSSDAAPGDVKKLFDLHRNPKSNISPFDTPLGRDVARLILEEARELARAKKIPAIR